MGNDTACEMVPVYSSLILWLVFTCPLPSLVTLAQHSDLGPALDRQHVVHSLLSKRHKTQDQAHTQGPDTIPRCCESVQAYPEHAQEYIVRSVAESSQCLLGRPTPPQVSLLCLAGRQHDTITTHQRAYMHDRARVRMWTIRMLGNGSGASCGDCRCPRGSGSPPRGPPTYPMGPTKLPGRQTTVLPGRNN